MSRRLTSGEEAYILGLLTMHALHFPQYVYKNESQPRTYNVHTRALLSLQRMYCCITFKWPRCSPCTRFTPEWSEAHASEELPVVQPMTSHRDALASSCQVGSDRQTTVLRQLDSSRCTAIHSRSDYYNIQVSSSFVVELSLDYCNGLVTGYNYTY